MSGLKVSDFKMFEKAPYKLRDYKNHLASLIMGIKEQEKTFGSAFAGRFIKNALRFIAQKTQEKTPEDIKNLDQLADYILSISDKHPDASNAILYAQCKTEMELQGQSGAGTRIGTIGYQRSSGIAKPSSAKERNVDLDQLISNLRKLGVDMKVAPFEYGYKKNEDESVDIILPDCYLKSGCLMALDEGLLKRAVGGMDCGYSNVMCQFLKMYTGYEWDYKLLEFDKPHCILRVFMI
ncbi:MAG: hypothetical protein WED07_13395 [Candidatus Freyarchaeum deiterrae]